MTVRVTAAGRGSGGGREGGQGGGRREGYVERWESTQLLESLVECGYRDWYEYRRASCVGVSGVGVGARR